MANNTEQKTPNIIGKIVWGFVVRIIITVVFAISVGKAVPSAAETFDFALPKWFKPVLIIGSIILGIVLEVLYAVRVFKILQAGFFNMEQMAANAATATFQEYPAYLQQNLNMNGMNGMNGVNGQYGQYNNGYTPQQGFPQGGPQPMQTSGVTNAIASPASSVPVKPHGTGCVTKVFLAFFITIMLGGPSALIFYTDYQYKQIESTYDPCTAIVTAVDKTVSTTIDGDGDEHTRTTYRTDLDYTYKGTDYSDQISSSHQYYVDEQIEIFVNPQDPKDTVVKKTTSDRQFSLTLGSIVGILYLASLISILKKK